MKLKEALAQGKKIKIKIDGFSYFDFLKTREDFKGDKNPFASYIYLNSIQKIEDKKYKFGNHTVLTLSHDGEMLKLGNREKNKKIYFFCCEL